MSDNQAIRLRPDRRTGNDRRQSRTGTHLPARFQIGDKVRARYMGVHAVTAVIFRQGQICYEVGGVQLEAIHVHPAGVVEPYVPDDDGGDFTPAA